MGFYRVWGLGFRVVITGMISPLILGGSWAVSGVMRGLGFRFRV